MLMVTVLAMLKAAIISWAGFVGEVKWYFTRRAVYIYLTLRKYY